MQTACCHVNEFCGKVELLGRICKDLPVVCPDLEKIAPRSSVSSSAFYIMPSQSYSTSQDFTISFSSSIPFEDSTSIEENVSIKEISSISTHSRTITPSSSSSTLLISSTMSMPWPNVVSSIYPYSTHHISYMTSSIAPWLPSQDVPETFRKWLLKEVQEYAKCHYGTKFCALNQECIPLNENCTIHLANDILRNSTSTPWCSNCSTGTFFCPSYMKCINVNQSCSYADLFHWHRNENFSIGPLGLICGANETYCIFTMSCMPNTTVCEKQIHYNAKRKKAEIVCKLGERFCPYTSSCKKLSDCRAAPSLNLSKALEDDYFGGKILFLSLRFLQILKSTMLLSKIPSQPHIMHHCIHLHTSVIVYLKKLAFLIASSVTQITLDTRFYMFNLSITEKENPDCFSQQWIRF